MLWGSNEAQVYSGEDKVALNELVLILMKGPPQPLCSPLDVDLYFTWLQEIPTSLEYKHTKAWLESSGRETETSSTSTVTERRGDWN